MKKHYRIWGAVIAVVFSVSVWVAVIALINHVLRG